MKTLHALNIFITIALWISSYYLIAWKKELWDEFSRVGWENYEGLPLKTPNIYFARLVMLGAAFACYTGIQTYRKHKWKWGGVLLSIMSLFSLFLGVLLLGGGAHLSEKQAWTWQPLFVFNIILSVIALIQVAYPKPLPLASNDILDDPNSIIHHESEEQT